MNKQERIEQAAQFKNSGKYNCCQAVIAALADQTELSEEQLLQLAAGFGIGMGNMEGSCGSLVGAGMIAGLASKGQGSMRLCRQISDAFRSRSGAVVCKTLKGRDGQGIYCDCEDCVRNAVEAYCQVMGIE